MTRSARAATAALLLLAASAAARAQGQSVPFEIVENVVVARGTINGREAIWIVDTGANATLVTPASARRAGVPDTPDARAQVAVGGARLPDVPVIVGDPEVARFVRRAGVDYTGIVGTTYLDRFAVTFDYPGRRLTFAPLDGPAPEGPGAEFEVRNRLMIVTARVGTGRLRLLLDTGAASTLIRPEAARRLRLEDAPVPGRSDVRLALIPELRVGDVARRDVDAVVHEPPQGPQLDEAGLKCDGFLGYSFLSHFRVTIDAKRRRLVLEEPRPALPETPAPLGLTLEDTRVAGVGAGSAAARAGFAPGDVIVSIAGQEVRFVEEIRGLIGPARGGAKLPVVVRRAGELVHLTLVW